MEGSVVSKRKASHLVLPLLIVRCQRLGPHEEGFHFFFLSSCMRDCLSLAFKNQVF